MPRSPPTPPGRAPKSASSRTPRPPCRLQCHSPHRRFLARRAPPPASLLLDSLPQSLFFLASSVRRSTPTLGTRLPRLDHRSCHLRKGQLALAVRYPIAVPGGAGGGAPSWRLRLPNLRPAAGHRVPRRNFVDFHGQHDTFSIGWSNRTLSRE